MGERNRDVNHTWSLAPAKICKGSSCKADVFWVLQIQWNKRDFWERKKFESQRHSLSCPRDDKQVRSRQWFVVVSRSVALVTVGIQQHKQDKKFFFSQSRFCLFFLCKVCFLFFPFSSWYLLAFLYSAVMTYRTTIFNATSLSGWGTWPFCGQIVEIWPYPGVACPQNNRFVFEVFLWVFLKIWPNLYVVRHSRTQTWNFSTGQLSQARFASWQLKLFSLIFQTQRTEIVNDA